MKSWTSSSIEFYLTLITQLNIYWLFTIDMPSSANSFWAESSFLGSSIILLMHVFTSKVLEELYCCCILIFHSVLTSSRASTASDPSPRGTVMFPELEELVKYGCNHLMSFNATLFAARPLKDNDNCYLIHHYLQQRSPNFYIPGPTSNLENFLWLT